MTFLNKIYNCDNSKTKRHDTKNMKYTEMYNTNNTLDDTIR